jgi:hypothetical protein
MYFSYVDDVLTSEETHLWASTACYRDSFTFLYVGDVRTSQEARPVNGDRCTFSLHCPNGHVVTADVSVCLLQVTGAITGRVRVKLDSEPQSPR